MASDLVALSTAKRILERYAKRAVLEERPKRDRAAVDALFRLDDSRFVLEVKSNARSASVAGAIAQLREYRRLDPDANLLVVVPSMGEAGAAICEEAGVDPIDLNGNASIDSDDFHIYVRGKRDISTDLDGAAAGINPFSRNASRVPHALLTDPRKPWTRAELELVSHLDKGYVSKIVTALAGQGYVEEVPLRRNRTVRVSDPLVLLDAWRERYKPKRARFWGLIAARSGAEALENVVQALSSASVDYAITGLGAAEHYTHFGSFRRVDAYLGGAVPESVAERLNIGTNDRGRNVAFYDDFGNASIGLENERRVRVASPVLTYLDLAHLPERSEEASDEMRRYLEKRWG